MWVCVFGATPISIGHLLISLCLVWVRTAPISIGHLPYQFEFSRSHLYRLIIFCVNLSQDRTYIDRSFFLPVWVWVFRDRTYIDRSSSLLVWVFGITPISIDHLHVNLCLVRVGTTPISIGHFSCQNKVEFFGTTPISIGHLHVNLYLVRVGHVNIRLSFSRPHLYRSVIHLVSWVESYSASSHTYLVESVRPWATLYPPFEFMAHISVMLLGAPCLSFSCSTHIVVPFGLIFSYTPRWFDRYSSLTFTFESLLETS